MGILNRIKSAANKVGDAIAKPVYKAGDAVARATGLDKVSMPRVKKSKKSRQNTAPTSTNILNKIGDILAAPVNAVENVVYKAGDAIAGATGLDKAGIRNPVAPMYQDTVRGIKDVVHGAGDVLAGDVTKGAKKVGSAVVDTFVSPLKATRNSIYDAGDVIAAKAGWDKGGKNTIEELGPAPKKPEQSAPKKPEQPAKTPMEKAKEAEVPPPPGSSPTKPRKALSPEEKIRIEWSVSNRTRDQYIEEQKQLFLSGKITTEEFNNNIDAFDDLSRRRRYTQKKVSETK